MGERFYAFVQFGSGTHTASYKIDTWAFSGGAKLPGHVVDHPTSSSVEVKERVELYLYSALCLEGVL
jgi:hypothetical protein